jgi:guanylate kinase
MGIKETMGKGKLIVFSAPSGSGKTTLVHYLLKKILNLSFSISATSRKPRENEIDGKDYFFLSKENFISKINNGKFLEYEEVYDGIFYGTLLDEVEKNWEKGKHVIFDIDVVGGINIKKLFPERTLAIFVKPPSIESLEERLNNRGDDSPEEIHQRVKKAIKEMEYSSQFDQVILNDKLEESKRIAFEYVDKFLSQ